MGDLDSVEKQLRADTAAANDALAFVNGLAIDSPTKAQRATDAAHAVRAWRVARETKRDGILAPIKEAQKRVIELFRRPIEDAKEAERLLKSKLREYHANVHRVQKQALAEARSQEEVTRAIGAILVKPQGYQTRTYWKVRITDLAQVPLEYLVPDMQKLNAVARELKDKAVIPGCEVVCETREALVPRR